MNFIRPVVQDTMDNNSLVEFGQLKYVISVNIVDLPFFHGFQPKKNLIGLIKDLAIFHFCALFGPQLK